MGAAVLPFGANEGDKSNHPRFVACREKVRAPEGARDHH